MPIRNDNLDDDPVSERVESFAGGVDAYRRSTLIDPDQSQLLQNIIVRENYEARTRPGADSIGTRAPLRPDTLTALAVSSSEIDLAWVNNALVPCQTVVSRSTVSGSGYIVLATVAEGVTTYADDQCNSATQYFYIVQAVEDDRVSVPSNEATATTSGGPPSPPNAPTLLTATSISSTEINLAWVDNSLTETGLTIFRATNINGPFYEIASIAADATAYSDTGLTPLTQYFYIVIAYNAGGASTNSNTANAFTWGEQLAIRATGGLVYFNGGGSLAAGNYKLYYVTGAQLANNGLGWLISIGGANAIKLAYVFAGGSAFIPVPADYLYYASQAALQAAIPSNSLFTAEFTHGGGGMSINVGFGNYTDGVPNPTFQLRRIS